MKYNSKYDKYVTKGGLVYRYSKRQGKLILYKPTKNNKGYLQLIVSKHIRTNIKVHRLVYETFIGEIPQGCQIDHINTVRDDNRLENLRCVTPKENSNNPLTRKHRSGINGGEFYIKFKEHFGITRIDNQKLYKQQYDYYRHHNKVCKWEQTNE